MLKAQIHPKIGMKQDMKKFKTVSKEIMDHYKPKFLSLQNNRTCIFPCLQNENLCQNPDVDCVLKCNVLLLSVLLLSCFYGNPVTNQSYQVDYLFEHDGCKVYRFYDRGQYVYFTNCQGEVTSIKNDSTAVRVTNSVRITYDDYDKTRKN